MRLHPSFFRQRAKQTTQQEWKERKTPQSAKLQPVAPFFFFQESLLFKSPDYIFPEVTKRSCNGLADRVANSSDVISVTSAAGCSATDKTLVLKKIFLTGSSSNMTYSACDVAKNASFLSLLLLPFVNDGHFSAKL